MTNFHTYAQWVNDQLDLYNYALRIGDSDWQLAIIQELHDKESFLERQRKEQELSRLWKEFEEINVHMEAIYSRLREALSDTVRSHLWEAAWRLKKERGRIARILRDNGEILDWRREKNSSRG